MKVLLTGGAGYIGSHTAVALLEKGHEVISVDNFCNSSRESYRRIEQITGREIRDYEIDVCDYAALVAVVEKESPIDGIVHFAGLKCVPESAQKPLEYYQNNLVSAMNVLKVQQQYDIHFLVFSSSATVYGANESPLLESMPLGVPTNPYGHTKKMIEQIIQDALGTAAGKAAVILRYFNPIGAHPSGLIGEDPNGVPNNLIPYITQVAVGRRDYLVVYGTDYDTHDGTGVRDYIHVCDLAEGHVKALEAAFARDGVSVFNLGTGRGYSVYDVVHAFEKVNHVSIPVQVGPRRAGDIDTTYADVSLARTQLDFAAKRNLEDMCRDSWNWQQKNPNGYVERNTAG